MAGTLQADFLQPQSNTGLFILSPTGSTMATVNTAGIYSSTGAQMLNASGNFGSPTANAITVSGNVSANTLITTGTITSNTLTSATGSALTLQSAGTTAITVDTSQNVGIGTSSPSQKLEIASAVGGAVGLRYIGNSGYANIGTDGNNNILFGIGNPPTEKARIDSSGRVSVGGTAGASYFNGAKVTSYGDFAGKNDAGTLYGSENAAGTSFGALGIGVSYGAAGLKDINLFLQSNAGQKIFVQNRSAGVYLSDGGTSWSSNSDERLKTNLVPIENALNKVSTLRTVIGEYKNDELQLRRPFLIAQDVQAVLPEAVGSALNKEDGIEYLGIQYTDVIPLLTAAIKELGNTVSAQANTISVLESRLAAANIA